jgi:NodT family efflux transporter outer membrane factor (OMF) lipoprotein
MVTGIGTAQRTCHPFWQGGLIFLGVSLIAACAPPARPPQFAPRQQAPLAGTPTGTANWPQEQWWKRYHDPQLDRLMALATRDSPDLQQAQARYTAAERAVDAQKAQLNPQVRGYFSGAHAYSKIVTHAQPSGGSSGAQSINLNPRHSWANDGLAAALFTWDLDLWGKQKDAVAQAIGQANAAKAERAMAANSLHYNVARTYFDWQSQQARLQLAEQAAQDASTYRSLVAMRVHAGLDDPQMLDQADAQLAARQRDIATLQGASSLDLVQLAAVAGVSAQELGALQAHALPVPDTDVPPYAGLELIARRPDIVANRWQIESSIKGIESARAAYYPDVSLLALGAYLRMYPNLGSGTRANIGLGNVGASVSLPIFSGGRLKAQLESRQADLDDAVATYNSTVVQAAHDVAQQIATMQQLQAEQVQTDRQFADVSAQNQRADRRRQRGLDDDRNWLSLQMQLAQQRDAQVQVSSQLLTANLALIYALGGGYHDTHAPTLPSGPAAQDASR